MLWNKKEWQETSPKIRWGEHNKLTGCLLKGSCQAPPKLSRPDPAGAALKSLEKAINPFPVDRFLDETRVQRGPQGVSLSCPSPRDSDSVHLSSRQRELLCWSPLRRQLAMSLWESVPDLEIAGEEQGALLGSAAIQRKLQERAALFETGSVFSYRPQSFTF